jgi:hypothetical protein
MVTAPAAMPIEIDTGSIVSTCGGKAADVLTIPSVSVDAQPKRILVVTVGAEEDDDDCDLGHSEAVVTYGEWPLELAVASVSDRHGHRACNSIFYLLSPPVGREPGR